VGISTVFGNAPLEVTDRTARELAAFLRSDGVQVPVYRGGRCRSIGHPPTGRTRPPRSRLRRSRRWHAHSPVARSRSSAWDR
jgi:hypothetical protein